MSFSLAVRVKDYIRLGLDKNIIDPDKGSNITRKLELIQKAGINEIVHPNLRAAPQTPDDGWSSNLGEWPFVSFASLYKNFIERPVSIPISTGSQSVNTPEEFYLKNVVLTAEEAARLEVGTGGQSTKSEWFLARRI